MVGLNSSALENAIAKGLKDGETFEFPDGRKEVLTKERVEQGKEAKRKEVDGGESRRKV